MMMESAQLANREEDRVTTVARALREDVGDGDLTASLISPDAWIKAVVFSRESAVLSGREWVDEVFRQVGGEVALQWFVEEGGALLPNVPFCELQGPARQILTAERTALNFLQLMSGIATVTRTYASVIAAASSRTILLDTRKTLPGLRAVQKYATRCGGARNHRMGLYDAILIKENHICAAGSIGAAVEKAQSRYPGVKIEVEVETLEQLDEAIQAGVQWALLDNFSLERVREAVQRAAGRIRLEVSGNVTLETLGELAATGIDAVSVGALTKHVRAIDLSMRVVERG